MPANSVMPSLPDEGYVRVSGNVKILASACCGSGVASLLLVIS